MFVRGVALLCIVLVPLVFGLSVVTIVISAALTHSVEDDDTGKKLQYNDPQSFTHHNLNFNPFENCTHHYLDFIAFKVLHTTISILLRLNFTHHNLVFLLFQAPSLALTWPSTP